MLIDQFSTHAKMNLTTKFDKLYSKYDKTFVIVELVDNVNTQRSCLVQQTVLNGCNASDIHWVSAWAVWSGGPP